MSELVNYIKLKSHNKNNLDQNNSYTFFLIPVLSATACKESDKAKMITKTSRFSFNLKLGLSTDASCHQDIRKQT